MSVAGDKVGQPGGQVTHRRISGSDFVSGEPEDRIHGTLTMKSEGQLIPELKNRHPAVSSSLVQYTAYPHSPCNSCLYSGSYMFKPRMTPTCCRSPSQPMCFRSV